MIYGGPDARCEPRGELFGGVISGGVGARHAALGCTGLATRASEPAGVGLWELAQEEQAVWGQIDPGLCAIRGHEDLLQRCQSVQLLWSILHQVGEFVK